MHRTNGHVKATAPPSVLDDGDMIQSLMSKYYPELIELAFTDANTIPGIAVTFNLQNEFVQDMLDILATQVRGIADTTRAEIAQIITEAAAEGLDTADTAARIRQVGFTDSVSRSKAIARTESASGYTAGSLTAYQISGVVKETEWLSGSDPCEICIGLDGSVAALGSEFAPGVIGPPAHVNCTCVLSPIVNIEG